MWEIDKNHLKIGLIKIYASTDYGHPEILFLKNFGIGQTNWAENFGGIWGILGRFLSINHYFYKKPSVSDVINSLLNAFGLSKKNWIGI